MIQNRYKLEFINWSTIFNDNVHPLLVGGKNRTVFPLSNSYPFLVLPLHAPSACQIQLQNRDREREREKRRKTKTKMKMKIKIKIQKKNSVVIFHTDCAQFYCICSCCCCFCCCFLLLSLLVFVCKQQINFHTLL